MKTILHFVILFFLPFQLLSKDGYSIGDTLYVWSDNGLKIREEPGLKARALEVLYACDPVVVSEITENEQAVKMLDVDPELKEKHPYFLKGNWVKVTTLAGRTGYVLDVYLLAVTCHNVQGLSLVRRLQSILPGLKTDTIHLDLELERVTIKSTLNGMEIINEIGSNWSGITVSLEGWTIEEAFVLFNFIKRIYPENSTIRKNWIGELNISRDICDILFKDEKIKIVITETCHC